MIFRALVKHCERDFVEIMKYKQHIMDYLSLDNGSIPTDWTFNEESVKKITDAKKRLSDEPYSEGERVFDRVRDNCRLKGWNRGALHVFFNLNAKRK